MIDTSSTKKLLKAGLTDEEYMWLGFIAGAIAKGLIPGEKELNTALKDLLNGGETLPGALSAAITSEALGIKHSFESKIPQVLPFPDEHAQDHEKLRALAELASGLNLGLALEKGKGMASALEKGALLDFVRTLGDIAKVDLDGTIDPEDLKSVLDYINEQLSQIFEKNQSYS